MTEKKDFVYFNTQNSSVKNLLYYGAVSSTKSLRDNDGKTGYGSRGWYYAAPEPTSGLLMLVGGMLLGLRRKRV